MPVLHAIRDARDEDALDIIELIGAVFGEYTGCVMDVDGEMPELRRIASSFREHDGQFWVAERDGRIVGMGGFSQTSPPSPLSLKGEGEERERERVVELKKLYVHRRERKTGLGGALVDRIEAAARERNARRIELWSDTRFTTAHAFYERRGYLRGGTRELHDLSKTVEFHFTKVLG